MKLRVASYIILCVLLGFVGCQKACQKTAEDEQKAFDKNSETVKKLVAVYPGFKGPLEAKLDDAKKKFEEAKQVAEEEAKVKAMGAANGILTGGFIADLKGLDTRIKTIQEKIVELEGKATDETRNEVKAAVAQARKTLKDVEEVVKTGASDETGATAILEKVNGDLASASTILEKVEKSIADKAQATAEANAAAQEQAEAEAAQQQPWTCEYCTASNAHDATECTGCGADKPSE